VIELGHILCPVDFSEFSERALHHAMAMARWYDARLTVLHIFVNLPTLDVPPITLNDSDRRELLTEMRRLAGQPPPDLSIDFLVREAPDVRRDILDQAEALKADLLVIGSHGRSGFEKLLLGSVTEQVIRKATCPVMVVPRGAPDAVGTEPVHFSRILCPVDFSDASLSALEYAMDIAQEANAQLTVVHVINVPPELRAHYPASGDFNVDDIRRAAQAECLRHLRSLIPESVRTYCGVETVVQEGAAYGQILRVAAEHKSDLIVMGVHGRGAMDLMLFGSNTARVIRAATCPVLVVRQQ
jgi:nucleotide-binding universal stress UspA family protein